MYNNVNRLKNIELPENLFSNLGESKKKKKETTPKEEKILEKYNIEDDLQENEKNNSSYRKRITKMYEKLEELIPINNEINDTLFFNNYVEKGIVIKPKISSLKQFWTEYRLIDNEKSNPKINIVPNKANLSKNSSNKKETNNFDELFTALSERVTEINKYIDELKEMKTDIDE